MKLPYLELHHILGRSHESRRNVGIQIAYFVVDSRIYFFVDSRIFLDFYPPKIQHLWSVSNLRPQFNVHKHFWSATAKKDSLTASNESPCQNVAAYNLYVVFTVEWNVSNHRPMEENIAAVNTYIIILQYTGNTFYLKYYIE